MRERLGARLSAGRAIPFGTPGELGARLRVAAGDDVPLLLVGAALLVLLNAVPTGFPLVALPRMALGIAYVLFVPGYALVCALFPASSELDRAEQAGLSVGVSIVIVALLAPALDRLSIGLRPWPLLLAELAVIVPSLGFATWRRIGVRSGGAPDAPVTPLVPTWRTVLDRARAAVARRGTAGRTALVLVSLAAAAGGWMVLSPAPDPPGTEFYVVGPDGYAGDYPYRVAVDEEMRVTVGVVSHEAAPAMFHIEARIVGPDPAPASPPVLRAAAFTLAPGEGREETGAWRMPSAGDGQQVELLLLEDGVATPYRQLRLVVDVGQAP